MAEAASHEKCYFICKNPGIPYAKTSWNLALEWKKRYEGRHGLKQHCSMSECFITGKTPHNSAGLLWELVVISRYCDNTNFIVHLTQSTPVMTFQIFPRKRNLVNVRACVYLTCNTYKMRSQHRTQNVLWLNFFTK